MNLYDLSVDVIGAVAQAFCRFEFSCEQGEGDPFVIEGRVSFVLRHHDGAWRFIHYHESVQHQMATT